MEAKAVGATRTLQGAIVDLVELAAKALISGIGAAVLMSLAILALSAGAQAAGINDANTGTLLLRTDGQYTVAPTVATEVAIQVTGMVARTKVTQHFHNPGAEFVEGVYVFPLPEKAAVDRLWMRIGARTIEGRIREKQEARRAYEQARKQGRKAAIVEQQRPNLFTNSVAHIGPGERVEIRIEYQQPLAYDQGEYRLRFPLAVTPRYIPVAESASALPDQPKAAEAETDEQPVLHPAYAADGCGDFVNPVDIVVFIDSGVPLGNVVSSYHETIVEKAAANRTVVYLSKEQDEADRDFELRWSLASGAIPQAAIFTHHAGETDYALIMVVPPAPGAAQTKAAERLPRETLVIVDTSGSMEGVSMQQAKQAVEFALDTLTPRDRFNVIEFNSVTRPMWTDSLPATGDNLRRAKEWVRGLKAGGGTVMAPALTFAFDGRETPGYLRQVVFMTDGGVGNEEELFRLIVEKLGNARLFTVGIGAAPNSHFMSRAAQFGRGTHTHVGDVKEVNEKMSRLFARIEAPVLRDVAIKWPDGTPVETFPARVPDLYLGEPVLVSAAARAPLGTVVVSGMRGNQPWSAALTPSHDAAAMGVGALWARAKIASLMDEITRGADAALVRPKVVQVALEHHLVSAYTSLVAVDVTPTAPAGDPRIGLVKASLPHGWSAGTQLPQTDTAATLQLLLGFLALCAAGIVMLLGRRAARIA